ncbi:MAG: DUF4430 domain-containing protein [Coriobacteriia bacterium]|nr:DUF4430 domain-containing protein [Coriobacteriia bacterium]
MNETVKTDSSIKKDGMRKKKILITLVCVAAIILAGAGLGYRHLKADGFSLAKSALFQTTEASRGGLSALASADASSTTDNSAAEKSTAASVGGEQTSSQKQPSKSTSTESSKKKSSPTSSTSSNSTKSSSSSGSASSKSDTQKSTIKVTLSIDCKTAVAKNIQVALDLTKSGSMLSTEISVPSDSTVYDVLMASSAVVDADSSYMGVYVKSIGGLAEKAGGYSSAGWQYEVNGVYPSKGCSSYTVSDGDTIKWRYSCDAGKDL